MRISDWSSDVCSSDLNGDRTFGHGTFTVAELKGNRRTTKCACTLTVAAQTRLNISRRFTCKLRRPHDGWPGRRDRKRGVSGKRVSVRVELGGRRCITNKQYRRGETDDKDQTEK